jgi:hypothetical protein
MKQVGKQLLQRSRLGTLRLGSKEQSGHVQDLAT